MHKSKAKHSQYLPVLVAIFLITACQPSYRFEIQNNYTEQDLFVDQLFEPIDQLPSIEQIFTLTPAQEKDFLKAFNSNKYRSLSGSERIYKYLQNRLQYFNFQADTLMASESLSLSSGNCLSLAIATRAIAQLVNVGTYFELARTEPVFKLENNIQLTSQHIRTVVYVKEIRNTKQYINPNYKIRIDYFPSFGSRTLRRVSQAEFFAMFYINRAAEAIVHDHNDTAYWHLKRALKLDSDNPTAINMLGVLYRRIGDEQVAERVFKYGLSLQTDQLELLNNYHKLLLKTERLEEAAVVATQLEKHHNKDPFNWLDLAHSELRDENFAVAIKYFDKAIELADYMHQAHAGKAEAYFKMGRKTSALNAMRLAINHTRHLKTIRIYEAKYEHFKAYGDKD